MWVLLVPAAWAETTGQVFVTGTWAVNRRHVLGGIEVAAQVAPGGGTNFWPVCGGAVQVLGGDGDLYAAATLRSGGAFGVPYGLFEGAHTLGLATELDFGISLAPGGPALRVGGVATAGSRSAAR